MKANRIDSRMTAESSGSARSSAIGWTHNDSGAGVPNGVPGFDAGVMSVVKARRCALRSMSTQMFVAMR
jgi:hypothetical protein